MNSRFESNKYVEKSSKFICCFLSDFLLLMVLIHIEELIWIIPMEIEESRLFIFWYLIFFICLF